jgi:formate dehydrogenase major subunit
MRDFIIPGDDRDMGTPAKAGAPVTLTIDGIDVTVPEGTSVMRAAAEAGIAVPKLCATDSVEAFGSCRLCVVEIEGRRGTPASCTTPVAEGMVVHTQAESEEDPPRRDGALYLRPPARLPDLCGQRRLRAAGHGRRRGPARRALRGAAEGGLANHFEARNTSGEANPEWIAEGRRRTPISPMIPSKCIVCSRCVRACEEVQGTFALTIEGRGFDSRVSARRGGRRFPVLRLRQLRRLRAGLPDGDAAGEIRDRARHAHALGRHDLRLLRGRLFLQGGTERRRAGAHGALQARQGQSRAIPA